MGSYLVSDRVKKSVAIDQNMLMTAVLHHCYTQCIHMHSFQGNEILTFQLKSSRPITYMTAKYTHEQGSYHSHQLLI